MANLDVDHGLHATQDQRMVAIDQREGRARGIKANLAKAVVVGEGTENSQPTKFSEWDHKRATCFKGWIAKARKPLLNVD